jgi:hypothetical protein
MMLSKPPTKDEVERFERGGAHVYRLPAPEHPSTLTQAALTARARASVSTVAAGSPSKSARRPDGPDLTLEGGDVPGSRQAMMTYPAPRAVPVGTRHTSPQPHRVTLGHVPQKPPAVKSFDVADHIRAMRDPARREPRPPATSAASGPMGMLPRDGVSVRSIPRFV